ncbi:MAG TPA: hypothetical protein VGN16_21060 [Acidobacteriaceae bacterium]
MSSSYQNPWIADIRHFFPRSFARQSDFGWRVYSGNSKGEVIGMGELKSAAYMNACANLAKWRAEAEL